MKILILSTGRGLRPEYVEELRTKLALLGSDEMRLISWQRSGSPLPVDRHLVVGPHLLTRGGQGKDQKVWQPTRLAPFDGNSAVEDSPALEADSVLEQSAALGEGLVPDDSSAAQERQAPGTSPVLEAGTTLEMNHGTSDPASETAARVREKHALARLPAWHPRRLRAAAAWRARRLKRAASIRTRIRRHPQFRKVRNRLSPSASLGFAASCLRARTVHSMTRDSDLVIALDTAAHRGAWILAKRVPGPDVVIGVPAAERLLDQRRLNTRASAS